LADIPVAVIVSPHRPKMTISDAANHKFLVHPFKFPGQGTWNDITIKLVDLVDLDASKRLLDVVRGAGYVLPGDFSPNASDENYLRKTLSKRSAVNSLGLVTIETIDSEGITVETWKLHNAWVKDIDFDEASYTDETLLNLTLVLSYDWADIV